MRLYKSFIVIMVLLSAVIAYLVWEPFRLRPDMQHLLTYPNAEHVQIKQYLYHDPIMSPSLHSISIRSNIISFVSKDAPEKVLDFYRDLLLRDHWIDITTSEDRLNNVVDFVLPNPTITLSPDTYYSLLISATTENANQTTVQLKLNESFRDNTH